MPLILPEDLEDEWLNREDKESLRELIKPYDSSKLHSHTVRPLRGKEASGNSEEAVKLYNEIENELNEQQKTEIEDLFRESE